VKALLDLAVPAVTFLLLLAVGLDLTPPTSRVCVGSLAFWPQAWSARCWCCRRWRSF
jgi:hypothetical protein